MWPRCDLPRAPAGLRRFQTPAVARRGAAWRVAWRGVARCGEAVALRPAATNRRTASGVTGERRGVKEVACATKTLHSGERARLPSARRARRRRIAREFLPADEPKRSVCARRRRLREPSKCEWLLSTHRTSGMCDAGNVASEFVCAHHRDKMDLLLTSGRTRFISSARGCKLQGGDRASD